MDIEKSKDKNTSLDKLLTALDTPVDQTRLANWLQSCESLQANDYHFFKINSSYIGFIFI